MAYDNPAYVKDNIVRTSLDDFELQRMRERIKRAGHKDQSKYIRSLILADLESSQTVPQKAHG